MTHNAIIFDMDYTLLDRDLAVTSYARIQFRRYASEEHVEAMVDHFHRRDLEGFSRRHEVYESVNTVFNLSLPVDELVTEFEWEAWNYAELYNGVAEMLKKLRSDGFKLGIITNGSAKVQNLKVSNVGLRELVDSVAIAGELDLWKPDSRVFEHVCIALDVASEACVFVGDTPANDVIAAKNSGMTTVWRKAHHSWPDGEAPAYDYAVDDVVEILDLPFCRRR